MEENDKKEFNEKDSHLFHMKSSLLSLVSEWEEGDTPFEGTGRCRILDEYTYEGEFENGTLNGKGVLRSDDGLYYEGTFVDGEMEGEGVLKSPDGSEYVGDVSKGLRHGIGILVQLSPPFKFEVEKPSRPGLGPPPLGATGSFNMSTASLMSSYGGRNTLPPISSGMSSGPSGFDYGSAPPTPAPGTPANNELTMDALARPETPEELSEVLMRYEGNWSYDLPEGYGVLQYDETGNCVYTGLFLKGLRHGDGRMVYPNGDVYEGEVGNAGELKNSNGETYIGEWEGNLPHGFGMYTWPHLNVDNSTSTTAWPCLNCYEGDWVHGKRQGRGIFYYAHGGRYEGMWMENKKNGPGIMVEESGEVIAGIFKMDRFPQEKDRDVSESASQVIALEPLSNLEAVSDVVLRQVSALRQCYSSLPQMEDRRNLRPLASSSMRLYQWWNFALETGVANADLSLIELDAVMCVDGLCRGHDPAQIVLFQDFLSGLVRAAVKKYGPLPSVAASFQRLISEEVLARSRGVFSSTPRKQAALTRKPTCVDPSPVLHASIQPVWNGHATTLTDMYHACYQTTLLKADPDEEEEEEETKEAASPPEPKRSKLESSTSLSNKAVLPSPIDPNIQPQPHFKDIGDISEANVKAAIRKGVAPGRKEFNDLPTIRGVLYLFDMVGLFSEEFTADDVIAAVPASVSAVSQFGDIDLNAPLAFLQFLETILKCAELFVQRRRPDLDMMSAVDLFLYFFLDREEAEKALKEEEI